MFLSRGTIISIITLTVIAFIGLLAIQVVWIKRSVALNEQQFASKMTVVQKHVQESFMSVQPYLSKLVNSSDHRKDLFHGDPAMKPLEEVIRRNVDSVFKRDKLTLQYSLTARIDTSCYIHHADVREHTESDLAKSEYLVCLCSYIAPASINSLDIGFNIIGVNDYLIKDASGLVIPSLILLVLLIALFACIIVIISRQKSLAELKNDFINNLTHEFKTPLFSIGLTSKLLAKSGAIADSEKLKSYVDLIAAENARLQSQVDKILQITALESGSLMLEKKLVDANALIEKSISGFRSAVEEKGGTILFQSHTVKSRLMADEVHLSNVISNLLDNAYKYSNDHPEIVATTSNAADGFIIEVKDNGIGMDESSQRMIFDKFYRVKRGNVHDVKGFGLGLNYVKKIIEMHHGKITVKSKPGEGTTFTIWLPYE